jgi:hypothetical protein
MHDCCYYQLGILLIMIYPDIVSTVFCIQFWRYPHYYRMKKQAAVRGEPVGDRAESGEEKACKDSWKTFVNPIAALYRVDRSL